MRTVYFLGAGCSKNFGYPLTGEIMPEIMMYLKDKNLFKIGDRKTRQERIDEQTLLKYLNLVYPGLNSKGTSLKSSNIPNITEVLSLVDHLCFYNVPPHPHLGEKQLNEFRFLLNRAVTELLLDYEYRLYSKNEKKLLDSFVAPILKEKKNGTVSLITTNYDLSLDLKFSKAIAANKVSFGIPYRTLKYNGRLIWPKEKPLFHYFKLHGSLNWLKCDLCGQYYIHPDGSTAHQPFRKETDDDNTCICNNAIKLAPVLVAPSLVRDIRDSNLLQIWKLSIEAIRTADKLVIIGYSMPGEDLAIKSVLMRGLNCRSGTKPIEIQIVQKGLDARDNFKAIFGNNIKYYSNGLEEYLKASNLT